MADNETVQSRDDTVASKPTEVTEAAQPGKNTLAVKPREDTETVQSRDDTVAVKPPDYTETVLQSDGEEAARIIADGNRIKPETKGYIKSLADISWELYRDAKEPRSLSNLWMSPSRQRNVQLLPLALGRPTNMHLGTFRKVHCK